MMVKHVKEHLSFIEEARRKQIISGAVKTIARHGMSKASLEKIAEEINVSKGVISYHFSSKSELIAEIIEFLITEQRSNRESRMEKKGTAWEKITEYINADMDFYQHHQENMVCWFELMSYYKSPEEKDRIESRIYDQPRKLLASVIKEGQDKGEIISSLDTMVTATVIEGAIEGIMLQWIFNKCQFDLQKCGDELINLFEKRLLTG